MSAIAEPMVLAYCSACYDAVAEGARVVAVMRRIRCARCGKEPVIGHVPERKEESCQSSSR